MSQGSKATKTRTDPAKLSTAPPPPPATSARPTTPAQEPECLTATFRPWIKPKAGA